MKKSLQQFAQNLDLNKVKGGCGRRWSQQSYSNNCWSGYSCNNWSNYTNCTPTQQPATPTDPVYLT